mgnify:CR=1 FL=1
MLRERESCKPLYALRLQAVDLNFQALHRRLRTNGGQRRYGHDAKSLRLARRHQTVKRRHQNLEVTRVIASRVRVRPDESERSFLLGRRVRVEESEERRLCHWVRIVDRVDRNGGNADRKQRSRQDEKSKRVSQSSGHIGVQIDA